MSCPDGKHDLRAVNPYVHPTEKDAKGNPLEVVGTPPQSEEEPAWCRTCGALWSKGPFGLGWGFQHPLVDRDAPTLLNMIGEAMAEKGLAAAKTPLLTLEIGVNPRTGIHVVKIDRPSGAGCISQHDTLSGAVDEAREAILLLLGYGKDGEQ